MSLAPEADVIRKLSAAVQEAMHDEHAEASQGGVVTKWAFICETMTPDGTKHLVRIDGDGGGARLNYWDRDGLHHAALDRNWSDESGSEDDPDGEP